MRKQREVLVNILADIDCMQERILQAMYDDAVRQGQASRVRLVGALLDEFYNQQPDPAMPTIEIAGLMHRCVVSRGAAR